MKITGIASFGDAHVSIGFDVTPQQAVDYFRSKGLRESFNYDDLLAEEHAAAFTVAKMADIDLLRDVHESLQQALQDGMRFQDWADMLRPTLQAKGWWGRKAVRDPVTGATIVTELGSARRLETIFRTNMQSAYAVGQWQQIKAQQTDAPYLMYDAVDDFRTRAQHAAWDNKVLPVSSQWWDTHSPPNGYNCFLPETIIRGDLRGAIRRQYFGVAVEVRTVSGQSLRLTGNHPVLTRRGWMRADMLQRGDDLLGYRDPVEACHGRSTSGQMHDDQSPSTAEQVFEAFVSEAFAFGQSAPLKLDHDAIGGCEIDVDPVNRRLAIKVQSERLAGQPQSLLKRRHDIGFDHLPAVGTANPSPVTLDAVVSENALDITPGAAQEVGNHACTQFIFPIELQDPAFEVVITAPCGLPSGSALAGNTIGCLFDGLPLEFFGLASAADDDTLFHELSADGIAADAGLFGYLLEAHASQVFVDPVLNIRKFDFCGHVYDFQSAEGVLSADGIIAHNCRCGVIQLDAQDVESMGLTVGRAPRAESHPWKNPRTGQVEQIPAGVDPQFAHNPGQTRYEQLQKISKEKISQLPKDLQGAANEGMQAPPELFGPPRELDTLIDRLKKIAGTVTVERTVPVDGLRAFTETLEDVHQRFGLEQLAVFSDYRKTKFEKTFPESALAGYAPRDDVLMFREPAMDLAKANELDIDDTARAFTFADLLSSLAGQASKEVEAVLKQMGKGLFRHSIGNHPSVVAAHEYGHRLHTKYFEKLDKLVREGYSQGWSLAVSQYSCEMPQEFMAESFALYVTGDTAEHARIYPPLLKAFRELDANVPKEVKK
jgi:SPP1 gp7 family putative phage head morphogenesis protein